MIGGSRREEDAAHGRAVRRRVEPHLGRRRAPAQARRARRALRAARPRPLARSPSASASTCASPTTHDEAYAEHGDVPRRPRASTSTTIDEATPRADPRPLVVWGDPDEVGEQLTEVLAPRRRRLHVLAARPTATTPTASSCSARWVRPPSEAEDGARCGRSGGRRRPPMRPTQRSTSATSIGVPRLTMAWMSTQSLARSNTTLHTVRCSAERIGMVVSAKGTIRVARRGRVVERVVRRRTDRGACRPSRAGPDHRVR